MEVSERDLDEFIEMCNRGFIGGYSHSSLVKLGLARHIISTDRSVTVATDLGVQLYEEMKATLRVALSVET